MNEPINLKPAPGTIYKHFKGNLYEFIACATNSETQEEYVVYKALYGERGIWIRPASMFFGLTMHQDEEVQRFTAIEEEPK